MSDIDDALSQIAQIKAQLAVSTRFQGFAPEVLVIGGAVCAGAMLAQIIWPARFAGSDLAFVKFWAVVFAGVAVMLTVEAVPRSRRRHGAAADTMLTTTLRLLLPFTAAQAVIALVICIYAPGSIWLVPGLWQIVTALAAFSAVPHLPRAIAWAAGWFFACGTLVLAVAGARRGLSPWMMGGPFALGYALIGVILMRPGRDGQTRRESRRHG